MIPEKTVRYELNYIHNNEAVLPWHVKILGVFNRNMIDDFNLTKIEIVFEPEGTGIVKLSYKESNGDETEKVLANPSLKLVCESEGQKVIQGWLRMLRDDWYKLRGEKDE